MRRERGGAVGDGPYERAWRRAVRILGASAKSRTEIAARLSRAGIDEKIVESVLADLARRGWLDDRALAEHLGQREVRSAPAGRAYIEARIQSRGIAERTAAVAAARAIAGRSESADALELATQLLRRTRLTGAKLRAKLMSALARRGFDEDAASSAVDAAMRRTRPTRA